MILLDVRNLTKQYDKFIAVNGISFEITAGRCVSLLGPNGAGKTTTLNMLSGLLKPSGGTIVFPELNTRDIRNHIGYLPQYPAFYNWMTGREFLNYAGRLAHMDSASLRIRTPEILEIVGLKEAGNRKISGYSGGMKQRLGIAQALIHKPLLLILDEPVSALDPFGRREVLDMLRVVKRETTILFSTHVLHDAEEICDDVLIMRTGQLIVSGSLHQVRQQFQQPLIRIEAEQPLADWIHGIRSLAFIDDIDCNGSTAAITVNDMTAAKRYLLADLAAHNIPLLKFEVAQTSLEDLFMKVVSE